MKTNPITMKKIKAIVLLPLAIILLFCSCNTTNDGERAYSASSSVEEFLLDPYAAHEAPLPSDFGQDPLDLYMIDRLHLIQGNDQRMFVWTPEGMTAMPLGYTLLEDLPALDTSTNRRYRFDGRPVAGDMGLTIGLTINNASLTDTTSRSYAPMLLWD